MHTNNFKTKKWDWTLHALFTRETLKIKRKKLNLAASTSIMTVFLQNPYPTTVIYFILRVRLLIKLNMYIFPWKFLDRVCVNNNHDELPRINSKGIQMVYVNQTIEVIRLLPNNCKRASWFSRLSKNKYINNHIFRSCTYETTVMH